MNIRRWLAEPLVHFLAAGAALFLAAGWIWPAPEQGRVITVTEEDLLNHLQARAQLYDEASFRQLLDGMSAEDRAALVRETAVAEALYREGEALGLADNDALVRQRVIQQMRLLLMEEQAADVDLSDEEVRAFYDANQQRYAEGARVTFSHAYFSKDRGGGAEAAARAAMAQMNAGQVPFSDAGRFGDRFLYQTNYAEAGGREITGQFGEEFAGALLGMNPSRQWQGPIESEHGWHVIGMTAISAAQVPPFEQIASRVAEDALAEERSRRANEAIDALMQRYEVREDID